MPNLEKCVYCSKEFESSEARTQYEQAKHYSELKTKEKTGVGINFTKYGKYAIAIVAILAIGFWIFSPKPPDPFQITYPPILSPSPMHIHSTLNIYANGERIEIPVDVGIAGYSAHQPLHIHEADNKVHVESDDTRAYTLGNFFQVWRKSFNSTCVLDYCSDGVKKITMKINGAESKEFGEHVLKDGEIIEVRFE